MKTKIFTKTFGNSSLRLGHFVATFSLTLLLLIGGVTSSKHERRLIKHLTKNYNPEIRPVKQRNVTTSVSFEAEMVQLINVKERDQMMKTNMWLRMMWMDEMLVWDPSDYGGIEVLRIPNADVWNPDVVLLNNADGNFEVSFSCKVLVYSDGSVYWVPCSIYESSCTIDVKYFPFDEQICEMIFGSWSYTANEIKFKWYDGETKCDRDSPLCYSPLDGYVVSGMWDVMKAPGHIYFDGSGKTRQTYISYYYTLRRKTMYFIINLVIPCIIISSLSLFGFYMPADACEKVTLTITVLLSMMVFLLLVANILPDSSDGVPLISKYLLFVFFVNTIQVFIGVVCTNFNMRTPSHQLMPRWMNKLFLEIIPPLIGIVRLDDPTPGDRTDAGKFSSGATDKKKRKEDEGIMMRSLATTTTAVTYTSMDNGAVDWTNIDWKNLSLSRLNLRNGNSIHHTNKRRSDRTEDSTEDGFGGSSWFGGRYSASPTPSPAYSVSNATTENEMMPIQVHEVAEHVRFMAKREMATANDNNVIEDWRFLALVFDRFLLFIFVGVTIVGTAVILLDTPYLWDKVDQQELKNKWHDMHLEMMKQPNYIPDS